MLKRLLLALLLLSPLAAFGQFTTVTATVVDGNGIAYSGGTVNATLPAGEYFTGTGNQPPSSAFAKLGSTGAFTLQLADNTKLIPINSQWTFNICYSDGITCFTSTITISGTSQNVSSTLTAASAPITTAFNINVIQGGSLLQQNVRNINFSSGCTWNAGAQRIDCTFGSGGGNVSNSGTPTSGQIAQFVTATSIQGLNTTGSGNAVLATSPTLVTPILGAATGTSLTLSSLGGGGTLCVQANNAGLLSLAAAACGTGGGGGPTLQTNGVNNNVQTTLNFITSSTNAVGLTVTPSNSTSTETFEITGGSYTGNAATATKWATARALAGNNVDGSAPIAFANKFIVQGTTDAGLSAAQFLGALGTGILKNTTTTGVLSIAVAGDFPTLNQNTTGTAANLLGCTPSTAGSLCYWNGTAWTLLNGNASGTNFLQETSSGVPSWAATLSNPMTTIGDMIGAGASGVPARITGGLTGQAVVATNGSTPSFASPGLADGNSGAAVTTTPYVVKCDSGTAILDRSTTTRFQSGASVITAPDHTATGCGGNMAFTLIDDNAGTLTINRGGTDTFSVFTGTTATDGSTSFTLSSGQYATLNNGAGGVWEVRITQGGGGGGVPNPAANGIVACTGTSCSTSAARTMTATSPVTVTNGDGVAAAPAFACATCGVTGTGLNQFASTTSAQLAGVLSDETGTGVAVFSTSPTLVTPTLGVASATSVTTTGTTAGFLDLPQGTTSAAVAPCNTTTSVCIQAPTTVTSYVANVPGAAPTNNNSAWLFSNASPSVGSFAKMPQTAFLTGAAYTNATTTFSTVTGLSFSVEASTNYVLVCQILWSASAATAGPKFQFTGPASPTAVTASVSQGVTLTSSGNASATAFSTSMNASGTVVTSATNIPAQINLGLVNGTTAGTVTLQAAAQGTGTVTIQPGSYCQMQ